MEFKLPSFFRKTEVKQNQPIVSLFDLMNNPDIPIYFINPEKVHKNWNKREHFDIDLLIANIINTALDYNLPGFDTIHAHPTLSEAWMEAALIANETPIHFPPKKKTSPATAC